MKNHSPTFAQIGEIFNDATTRMVGGINQNNSDQILRDLAHIQSGLENLLQNHPDTFTGVAGIHAQNIVDQLNLEVTAIKTVGTDPFAAKYINDVQRDLIDIVQGDEQLTALANRGGHNGFAAVPDLLAPPAQFVGNAVQTEFMKNFVATSQDFADRAIALIDHNGSAADKQTLITQIEAYTQSANTFTVQQGGLYSARFNNEFASDGVNGTASRALIDGLQTGNGDKVHAAAEVLAGNSADVASNMLGIGDPVPVIGNGIPDHIDTFAQAGVVFNDATAKLVGGVYDGNRASIHNDLTAAEQGIKDLVANNPDDFQGKTGTHANKIVSLLEKELSLVDNVDAGPDAATQINKIHSQILNIVQHDATLAAAATDGDATGFTQLPGLLKGGGNGGHGHGGNGPAAPQAIAAVADTAGTAGAAADPHHQFDPLAHIFTGHGDHHVG